MITGESFNLDLAGYLTYKTKRRKNMKKALTFATTIMIVIAFAVINSYAQMPLPARVRIFTAHPGVRILCTDAKQLKEINCPEATYKNPSCNGITAQTMNQLGAKLCDEALAVAPAPQKKEETNTTPTTPDNLTKSDEEKLKAEAKQRVELAYDLAMQTYKDIIQNGIYEMYPSAMGGLIVEITRNATGKSFEHLLGSAFVGHLLVVWTEEHMKTTMKCQDRSMRKDYREVSDVLRLADTKFLKILKTIEEKAENKQNAKWMMDYYYNYEVPAIKQKYRNEKSIRKCN